MYGFSRKEYLAVEEVKLQWKYISAPRKGVSGRRSDAPVNIYEEKNIKWILKRSSSPVDSITISEKLIQLKTDSIQHSQNQDSKKEEN